MTALCAIVENSWIAFLKRYNIINKQIELCNGYQNIGGTFNGWPIAQVLFNVVGWLWGLLMISFYAVGFNILGWNNSINVWRCVKYYGIVSLLIIFVIARIALFLSPGSKKKKKMK